MYNPETQPEQPKAFPLERHRNGELEMGLAHLETAVRAMKEREITPVNIPMPFDRQPAAQDAQTSDWMTDIRRTIDEEAA